MKALAMQALHCIAHFLIYMSYICRAWDNAASNQYADISRSGKDDLQPKQSPSQPEITRCQAWSRPGMCNSLISIAVNMLNVSALMCCMSKTSIGSLVCMHMSKLNMLAHSTSTIVQRH